MKPLALNLSKVKKIGGDEHHSVFQHPDGHQIKIAHAPLSHIQKAQIKKMPVQKMAEGGNVDEPPTYPAAMFDDGGQVQDPTAGLLDNAGNPPLRQDGMGRSDQQIIADQNDAMANRSPASMASDFGNSMGNAVSQSVKDAGDAFGTVFKPVHDAFSGFSQGLSGTPAQAAETPGGATQPPAPSNPQIGSRAPMSAQSSIPMVPGADLGTMQSGFNQQAQGIQQEAAAAGNLGKENAKSAQGFYDQMNQLHQDTQSKLSDVQDNIDKTTQDIQNGHIDPQHYYNSKSTAGKVSTAIGLILGGIGGGLTHQENPAMKFLENQMSNDIDAQKANLGKSQNLLSSYYHQYGNLQDAERATQATYLSMYGAELQKAAAQNADPAAQARAQQLLGQLKVAKAQTLAPIAQRQAVLGAVQKGNVNPSTVIQYLAPEGQKEALMKDLQTKQGMDSANQDLMNAFDYSAKNNTVMQKLNPQAQSRLSAVIDSKLMGLAHASAGRFNMEEIPYVKAQFPSATDDKQTIALKRQNFQKMLQEKAHFPQLEPYGVSSQPSAASSFTPSMR